MASACHSLISAGAEWRGLDPAVPRKLFAGLGDRLEAVRGLLAAGNLGAHALSDIDGFLESLLRLRSLTLRAVNPAGNGSRLERRFAVADTPGDAGGLVGKFCCFVEFALLEIRR